MIAGLGGLRSLSVARRFLPQVAAHKGRMLVVGLLSLAVTLLELAKPWPVQWIVDHALLPVDGSGTDAARVVWTGAVAALLISLLSAVAGYGRELSLASVGHQVTRAIRHRIFEHLTTLSQRFHARHKSGDLLVRLMGDAPMVQGMLVESSVELATRTLLVAGTLVVMLAIDPVLAVAVVVALPLLALVVRMASRRIHVAVGKARRKEGHMADFLHEAVSGAAVLQSLGRERDVVRRFARGNRTATRAGLKAARLSAGLGLRVELLLGAILAASLGLGAWRVLQSPDGNPSAGELLVFMSYVRSLLKPLRTASKHAERIAKGTACGERILEVLDSEVDVSAPPGAPPAPAQPSSLAFEDVRFAYEPGRPALDGVSVAFHRGEVAGLFGRSGAGKSTLAALALRLFDPDRGRVAVDGIDVRTLDLASLRSRYGLCMQDAILFGETIRENLLLGRPDASDDDLWAVLRETAADDFVRALPGGLDASLGSAGAGLSGGQKRRLSLARTLLRSPPILVVDEPFAGLDKPAVARVRDALLRRARQGIVIVITHEREHLDVFDRVVWLEAGRVRGSGRHDELVRHDHDYRVLAMDGDAAHPEPVS